MASITTPPVNRATLDFTKANREAPLAMNAQGLDTNKNQNNNSVSLVSQEKHNIKQAKQPAWIAKLADLLRKEMHQPLDVPLAQEVFINPKRPNLIVSPATPAPLRMTLV